MLLLFLLPVFILYAILLLYLWQAWKRVPVFKSGESNRVTVSIIIPARNEEKNIGRLLEALRAQDYKGPTEVILVDDHSTDATAEIAKSFSFVKLLRPEEGGHKKKAIATGVQAAGGELIITTDADCIPSPGWLRTIVGFYSTNKPQAIAGPVLIEPGHSLLSIFQSLDFMMLQGITAATVHAGKLSMANGANLAYTKTAFNAVGGFRDVDHLASGDDMFLAYKIQRQYPGGYKYLLSTDAIVRTGAAPSFGAFLQQRQRWASKSFGYHDKRILPVLILVYLFNLEIFTLFILSFFIPLFWPYLGIVLVLKTIVEWPLMQSVANFFGLRRYMIYFPLLQPLHIFYTVIMGLLSLGPRYRWKDRTVK